MTDPVGNKPEATPGGKRPGGITGKGFMPGQSGNPNGRPKTATLSRAYRQKLEELYPNDPTGRSYAQVIAAKMAEQAASGDLAAAKELADRAEGKAAQSMKLEVNNLSDQFQKMSSQELEAYATTGALPEWFSASNIDPEEGAN